MRRDIHERECTNCWYTVQQSEKMIGGSPFAGWMCLNMSGGGTSIAELQKDKGPWDFCCLECACEWINNEVIKSHSGKKKRNSESNLSSILKQRLDGTTHVNEPPGCDEIG